MSEINAELIGKIQAAAKAAQRVTLKATWTHVVGVINGEHLITATRNNGALPKYILLMSPATTLALVDKTLEFERIASSEQALRLELQEKVATLEEEIMKMSAAL